MRNVKRYGLMSILLLVAAGLAIINLSSHETWVDLLPTRVQGKKYPSGKLNWQQDDVWGGMDRLPLISQVQIVDLDGDKQNELLVCDIQNSCVYAYRYGNAATVSETIVCNDAGSPAHASLCDVNADGYLDVVVADLGDVFPNNDLVGRLLLYTYDGSGYKQNIILDKVRRLADARCADFDGDGDVDIVVAEFGHYQGSVFWLEQVHGEFKRHDLLCGPGAIHVPVIDFDNDGDLDIFTVLSQDEEEVWLLINNGQGAFSKKCIHRSSNFELGSGGLDVCDIDGDGDFDVLLPAGDNLERSIHFPQNYHGCYLLENIGDTEFRTKRISDLPGTYAVDTGDLDNDGDLDVVLVSMSNDFSDRDSASVVALMNKGGTGFEQVQIAAKPIRLICCSVGDVNNDGLNDIVAGAFRMHPPFRDVQRLQAWIQLAP